MALVSDTQGEKTITSGNAKTVIESFYRIKAVVLVTCTNKIK